MNNFKKLLFVILLIVIGVYIGLRCIVLVGENVFAIVTDDNNTVISVIYKRINFIPEGIYKRIVVHYIPLRSSSEIEIIVPVPPLENIQSNYYAIKIPLFVDYTIVPNNISFDVHRIITEKNYISVLMANRILHIVQDNLKKYFYPYYKYALLCDRINEELSRAINEMITAIQQYGIFITNVSVGSIYIPNLAIYEEGKKFLFESLTLEKNNALQLVQLQHKLKEDQMQQERQIAYLEKVSKVIANNKDILKYIYIDKLAGNVKVIVTSDKGTPMDIFTETEGEHLKKDFDNFRK